MNLHGFRTNIKMQFSKTELLSALSTLVVGVLLFSKVGRLLAMLTRLLQPLLSTTLFRFYLFFPQYHCMKDEAVSKNTQLCLITLSYMHDGLHLPPSSLPGLLRWALSFLEVGGCTQGEGCLP